MAVAGWEALVFEAAPPVDVRFDAGAAHAVADPRVRAAQTTAAERVRVLRALNPPPARPSACQQHGFGRAVRATPSGTMAHHGAVGARASSARAQSAERLRAHGTGARAAFLDGALAAGDAQAPEAAAATARARAAARDAAARDERHSAAAQRSEHAGSSAIAAARALAERDARLRAADADAARARDGAAREKATRAALAARGRAKMAEDVARSARTEHDDARDAAARVAIRQLERRLAAHARRLARERVAARARADARADDDVDAFALAAERAAVHAAMGAEPAPGRPRTHVHKLTLSAVARGEVEPPVASATRGAGDGGAGGRGPAASAAAAPARSAESVLDMLHAQAAEVSARAARLASARTSQRAATLFAQMHEVISAAGMSARGADPRTEDDEGDLYGYRLSQLHEHAAQFGDAPPPRRGAPPPEPAVPAATRRHAPLERTRKPFPAAAAAAPARDALATLYAKLGEYERIDGRPARRASAAPRDDDGANGGRDAAAAALAAADALLAQMRAGGAPSPLPTALAAFAGTADGADGLDAHGAAATDALAAARDTVARVRGAHDGVAHDGGAHDGGAHDGGTHGGKRRSAGHAKARLSARDSRRAHVPLASASPPAALGNVRAAPRRAGSAPPGERASAGAYARGQGEDRGRETAPDAVRSSRGDGALHSVRRQFAVRTPVRAIVGTVGGAASDTGAARGAGAGAADWIRGATEAAATVDAVCAPCARADDASTIVHPPGSPPRTAAPFGAAAPRATPSGHFAHHLVLAPHPPAAGGVEARSTARPGSAAAGGVRQHALHADWHRRGNGASRNAPAEPAGGERPARGALTLCCGEPYGQFCCKRHHPDPLVVCCQAHDPLPLFRVLARAQRADDGRPRGPRGFKQPRGPVSGFIAPTHSFSSNRRPAAEAAIDGKGGHAFGGARRIIAFGPADRVRAGPGVGIVPAPPVALSPSDCFPEA
ncbi:hypothetical protein KFE25_007859 [Diacronema lutheri]|uniref:Uncharacterized protein n=1 Tax=Diacronema lutheri TaxID=2081491 RepID=A0A8J6CFP8_DIALT|nr:hypothetical protein KFE25_007859 [Diacronema lutheri]